MVTIKDMYTNRQSQMRNAQGYDVREGWSGWIKAQGSSSPETEAEDRALM